MVKKFIKNIQLAIYYLRGNMRRVVGGIIEKDGRILIARRPKISRLGGLWEFPGGKLEPDETPEECLKRELKEELDIDVKVGAFFSRTTFVYSHISIELLVYKVESYSGDIKLRAHDQIKWVTKDELKSVEFVPADKPVIAKILAQ